MIKHLSNSQIEMLLHCSWKHKLKYLDGFKEPTTDHLVVGSAVHRAVETYRVRQLQGTLDAWLTEEARDKAVIAAADEEFDKLVREADESGMPVEWTKGIHPDHARMLMHRLIETYFYKIVESDIPDTPKVPLAQLDQPESIEQEFFLPIPNIDGWAIKGRFDMRTNDALIDLKTASMRFSQRDMDKKTQPSFYLYAWSLMTGEIIPEFRYHVLIKPASTKWRPESGAPPPRDLETYRAAVQRTTRHWDELQWFGEYLQMQVYQIDVGAYVRRQNADFCDFCGLAKHCKPWIKDHVMRDS